MEKLVKHNHRKGELHHCLGGIGQKFVVDSESAEVLESGEGALDNPSFRKHLKFGRAFVRPEQDLHGPAEFFRHPVSKRALVSTVGKNLLQARELVFHLLDSLRCTLAVMEAGFII